MLILDRYIARKFLLILFFAIMAFIAVFIIVDLIENLDKFINNAYPTRVVFEFYLYYIPFILVLVFPVATLISALFSIGGMARQNEIVAMKAAGLSLYRILFPLFVISILLSTVAIGIANYLVPGATQRQSEIHDEYEKNRPRSRRLDNIYIRDEQDRRISIRYYNIDSNTGHIVSVREFEGNRLKSRIDAKRISWKDSLWILQDGFTRSFDEIGETAVPFTKYYFNQTSMHPENISRFVKRPEEMSFSELRDFIKDVKHNGGDPDRWKVDLYLKIALPFANFIIVLFGASLSAGQTRRSGAAMGFGISLMVTFIYFGILTTAQAMGHNGRLPPLLAAWFANIIFGVIGITVLIKARK